MATSANLHSLHFLIKSVLSYSNCAARFMLVVHGGFISFLLVCSMTLMLDAGWWPPLKDCFMRRSLTLFVPTLNSTASSSYKRHCWRTIVVRHKEEESYQHKQQSRESIPLCSGSWMWGPLRTNNSVGRSLGGKGVLGTKAKENLDPLVILPMFSVKFTVIVELRDENIKKRLGHSGMAFLGRLSLS